MSFMIRARPLFRQTARISVRSPVVSETAKRFSSTFSSAVRSGNQKWESHELRTLNPEWLALSGQEILDISGKTGKSVKISEQEPFFVRYSYEWDPRKKNNRRLLAPPDTVGFLYYHRPQGQPEIAGQLRFRVCSHATRFEQGHDLASTTTGVPWSIHLWRIVKFWPQFTPFLVGQGLVDQSLVDDIERLKLALRSGATLYSLSDPIFFKLNHEKTYMTFITRKAAQRICVRRLFSDQSSQPSTRTPYEGIIEARFELSDLPEHKQYGPTLVLRTQGILQPIVSLDPSYSGGIPMPEPGALLTRCIRGKRQIWFRPVNELGTGDNFDFPGLVLP